MKILFTILFLCVTAIAQAQYPNIKNLPGTSDFLVKPPWYDSSKSFIISQWRDTVSANKEPYVKNIPGLVIRVDTIFYVRSQNCSKWILINRKDFKL